MNQPTIIPQLKNKIIIQLSTGTPAEVRKAEQWFNQQGTKYLDGSIMVYPPTIGTQSAQLLISGDENVYQDCEPFINALGGDVRYLGENIVAAATLDLAVVTRLVTITVAIIHGAHVCESEGVDLQQFADLFPEGDRSQSLALKIKNSEFEKNISASVDVSFNVISSIKRQANDLGINSELPDFLLGLYQPAIDAGYQHQDNSSLIKIFRQHDRVT
ncbi:MAG: 3-hydroxyisobutyrate dehydrogenase-like beta-hydroxyacid dehydrogenase [Gammaproteobacteria bacterium]|jgi:3-hydroxyisobutyrate dehydrogenase-like beta-hydroxyacid dehydrogenase